jgi:hypothetical protein
MTRWTDFINEYVKHHGGTYKEALSNPEVKKEYWTIYPKHSPEGKEYKKIKDQTVKYQQQGVKLARDDAQKDLAELAKEQKVKDKSVQYRRDEAQKELSGIAKFQKLTDRSKQYEEEQKQKEQKKKERKYEKKIRKDYVWIVPLYYEYKHKYTLLLQNANYRKYTQLKRPLKILRKSIVDFREKLKSGTSKSLSKFITPEEFQNIEKTPLSEVGIQETGRPSKRIVEIIDTMTEEVNKLIETVPKAE